MLQHTVLQVVFKIT